MDQESAWAEELLAPLPGLGPGAGGYVGSRTCLGCHTENYMGWQETLHARTIQHVGLAPQAILADFDQPETPPPFDRDEVAYVIGEKWQQRFITAVEGELFVLPGQWNVVAQEWVIPAGAEGEMVNWRTECSYCHVTGLETGAWEFREFGIGCEGCHGPGEEHANAPRDVSVLTRPDDQVCGACHSRGTSPEGHPFPATYRPGDTLTDHFTFTADETTRWPDGSAKIHNQQYTDWIQSNKIQASDDLSCTTCHEVHVKGLGPSQTTLPTTQMCTGCHADKAALARHIPYHQQAMTRRDFACNDCHMPLMAISAVAYDIRSHTFMQPKPHGTLAHGGLEFMPNACNQCHNHPDQGPEWAAQTIDWAIANYSIVRTGYVFGPGPTPTAAPVPTPLPSVGEDFEVSAYIDFAWVRPVFFSGLGLLGAIGLLLFIRWLRTRRDD
jgi:predicted CXXCH cytochrome family protein